VRFTKYHALGNDYLMLEGPTEAYPEPELAALVQRICSRHRGVGADGALVFRGRHDGAHRFEVRNPDGSQAEMSGNGARIFARWLLDSQRVGEGPFEIESGAGVRIQAAASGVDSIQVTLAAPALRPTPPAVAELSAPWHAQAVSVGNPHLVLFAEPAAAELASHLLTPLAAQLEAHPEFPNRTNVQFAQALARDTVAALVFERGVGWTESSGSSAMAVVAAGRALGLLGDQVSVHMPGGMLRVWVQDPKRWTLSGAVVRVFSGDFFDGEASSSTSSRYVR